MKEQEIVKEFVQKHDLETSSEFRILDLVSEIGEIAGDAAKSSEYGAVSEALDVKTDEIGDALFALLALADSLDIDAGDALGEAIQKYEDRIERKGDVGSE